MSVLVSMVGDCVDVPEEKNTYTVPNLIEAVQPSLPRTGKQESRRLDIMYSLSLYLDREELCSYWQQLCQEQALYRLDLVCFVDRGVQEDVQYMMMLSPVYSYLVIHSQLNF